MDDLFSTLFNSLLDYKFTFDNLDERLSDLHLDEDGLDELLDIVQREDRVRFDNDLEGFIDIINAAEAAEIPLRPSGSSFSTYEDVRRALTAYLKP